MNAQPLTRDALVAGFHACARPRPEWRVGVELERHLLRSDGHPVPYFGGHGVQWLLTRLAANGWEPYFEGDNLIALFRDGASITLEPGSQFELSTAPFVTVAEVERQAREFVVEVDQAIGAADITPVALGYTPFAAIDEIPWVPKGRYVVMREHLAATGALAHDMMKGTCAVQASFDFGDEEDCARKVRLGILLGPITTALFANSPLTRGQPNGWASYRGHVWTKTDPRRTGFPEAAERFGFERWVEYLLDVPMMFLMHDERWRPANGRTFRAWLRDGIDGTFPTWEDWELHQTSVFPEVRVKKYIEIRGADCVPHALAMAFTSLFKGLLYDDAALDGATAVARRFASHGTSAERFDVACRSGLEGAVGGRRIAEWAAEIASFAREGLVRQREDATWLEPVARLIERGQSPAVDVLDAWRRDPRPAAIAEACRYRA